MSAVDLLPCPFCGKAPHVSPVSGGMMASCDPCMIDMLVPDWNRRAPVSAGKVKALAEVGLFPAVLSAHQIARGASRQTIDPLQGYVTKEDCALYADRILSALQPGDGWQGIESAPKDGTGFLIAYSDGTVRVGRYLDNSGTAWPWQGVRTMHGAERAGNKITHWMPLPAPPASLPLGEDAR